jgi:hypothetical protein
MQSDGIVVGLFDFVYFGLFRYIIEVDLKIKSTREDRMDLANENEKNGDRRNTYK